MKTTLFTLCLCALAYTSAQAQAIENDKAEDLVEKALEYLRMVMKKADHYSVQYEVHDHFRDFVCNMQVNLEQIKLRQADDFVIKSTHFNKASLMGKFLLEFPSPAISADYNITGTSFGKKANACGKAQWNVQNLLFNAAFQLRHTEGSISVDTIEFDYAFANQTFEMQQIESQGWSEQQVNAYLHQKSPFFMTLHREAACSTIAEHVKHQVNMMIKGKTLSQIIKWIESH